MDRWLPVAVAGFGLCLLVLDAFTPHGMSIAALYLLPLALTLLSRQPVLPLFAAALMTALLVTGFYISASGGMPPQFAIFNRSIACLTIWLVALAINRIIQVRVAQDADTWLKTHQAVVAEHLRGDVPLKELADSVLRYFATILDARAGALYSTYAQGQSITLERIATYAYPFADSNRPDRFQWGEGLVGQAAVERRMLFCDDLPPDYISVSSGLGAAPPRHLVVLPVTAGGDVRGAVELAFFSAPEPAELSLLETTADLLGAALRAAQQKQHLAELLEETQQQAEELQSQQEEMSALNEELEQQNKALLESRNQLENQAAELEQTNQMLEEQKGALDDRNQRLMTAERSLQGQKRELERASRYKSEFLANMSHELRTPLNSALILSKLLADNKNGNLTDDQVRYAQTINSAGNELLNLINDILDLSKVEAGKLDLRPELIDLHDVVGSIEAGFRPLANEKGLELRAEIERGAAPEIMTDRQRLEQILRNFMSNAVKFTESGSVTLTVVPRDHEVVFAVRDTGIGVPDDQQALIFEAFQQADGTDTRKYGGTGLGLAITRQLAQLLGGKVSLDSSAGQGSTFYVHLPRTWAPRDAAPLSPPSHDGAPADDAAWTERPAQPEPADDAAPRVERQTAIPTFSFQDDRAGGAARDRQILIIEDDEKFARILYELAHEMGFTALATPSAEEGMALARDYRPSAILLDIRLPDHSGLAVLEQLKSDPRTRHIPVHVISGEDFAVTARRMGAAGALLKPVKRGELERAFRELEHHISQELKHVLVVEDDAMQRESIQALIGGGEVRITAVETAREALDRLAEQTYDCMIIDLNLPDMSGQAMLAELSKADSSYAYPPVIVYTGRDLSREDEELLRRYSNSIIVKGARSPERLLSEVTLFLHRVETELPPERQKMLMDLRSREVALEGARLLIVDDDVRNIFALTSALEPHGARVSVARNGREALEKLDAQPDFDLVLMDVMMPEMNGFEAMRAIRKQDRFKRLPIIAVTAKAMRDDQQRCLQAGANDYLAKPVDLDKLLSLIRVWLAARRPA
jgi:signal transduction histidine kinase/CheY-like chemotaxis protein